MQAIETHKLKQILASNDDVLLVNTLDAEHFDQTRIPGAVNIPQAQDDFVAKIESEVRDKTQPVVVYCASRECESSTKAAKKLDDVGFTQVLDYEDGAKGWQRAEKMSNA